MDLVPEAAGSLALVTAMGAGQLGAELLPVARAS